MNIPREIASSALAAAVIVALAALAMTTTVEAQTPAAPAKGAEHAKGAAHTFATAEDAAAALADAVRAKSKEKLLAVVGHGSGEWLFSGDNVADANDWKMFLSAYDAKHTLEAKGDDTMILDVGNDDWPFPAPIVKRGDKWSFDAKAGKEEILNRRVGRNELDAMQTLLAVVDAEKDYAAADPDGNGFPDYARRFVSSPGKKDGLYWPTKEGEPESPLGPLVAHASDEGYGKQAKKEGERPSYHGYHYRILVSQGKNAEGGAYDYAVGHRLMGGFGVVAWPARHGVSGVTTFIVNQDGVVYEKDLGPNTGSIASHMTRFDPDATWRKAQ